MKGKNMAPVNKIKTYRRSSKSIVNSSVDAINILFAKNKAKVRRNKKRKLVVKELPLRTRGETLLADDSLYVSTEDTFDKLTKRNDYKKAKPKINPVKGDGNFSGSFKEVNSFYSPIMTRRRKRNASIVELSNSSDPDNSQAKKFKGNKSCSIIPRFLEPTVDKIDSSLEVENVQKALPNSISYIKLPDVKEGEISNNLLVDTSRRDISFDPIFSKSFREKQMVHCSTPLMPRRTKEKIINHTISPISNTTFLEKSNQVLNASNEISNSKKFLVPNKSKSSNVVFNSESKSIVDWKLKRTPTVLLGMCPEEARDRQFPKSLDSIQNSFFNVTSTNAKNSGTPRKSFITLRKRKVLKQSAVNKKRKKSKDVNITDPSSETHKNLTASLAEFNSFVDKLNGIKRTYNKNSHSFCDFESFMAQNKNLLGGTGNVDSINKRNQTEMETPANHVTKRRRRKTDSCLSSEKLSKNMLERRKRRFVFEESSCSELPQKPVLIPSINVNSPQNKTDHCNDIRSLIPMIDRGNTFFQSSFDSNNIIGSVNSSDRNYSSRNGAEFSNISKYNLRDLVVNLTNADLESKLANKKHPIETRRKMWDKSHSLFENSDDYVRNGIRHTQKKSLNSKINSSVSENSSQRKTKLNLSNEKIKKGFTEINELSRAKLSSEKKSFESDISKSNQVNRDLGTGSVNTVFNKRTRSEFEPGCSKNLSATDSLSKSNTIEEIIDLSRENNSGCIPNENTNIPAADFENFFVNLTKRSCTSRYTLVEDKTKKILDSTRQVSDHDKFENFFVGVTQTMDQLRPGSTDNNSVISEACSENLNRVNGVKDFESFFVDVMRSASESETNKFVMNEDHYNTSINEEKGEKEVIINVIRSPWRGKSNQPKANLTVINLTGSTDEISSDNLSTEGKTETFKMDVSSEQPIIVDPSKSAEISDIIESSLPETSQVDLDGFRIPMMGNGRRRHSKTLLLKAGKLWRRSLSLYRRSSMMLNLMNGTCIAKDGSHCICPKCNLSRETRRLTQRRCSIKIVPASPALDPCKETSILESYAHGTSYVSDQILEDNLENNIRSLSISSRRSSIIQNSAPVTARELVLRRCGQSEPIPFEQCYPKSVLQHCQKIGEGVYGEVFLFRNPNGGTSVMKVIPIEGDDIVNGERQKKFEEIFSEIIIAQELSNLRNNKQNVTSGFAEVQKVQCVQGRYPAKLVDLWELYDETRGSENDTPEIFREDQLYIVLQLANGGQDLEAFVFNNALQAYTMFQQVACTLAIAEEQLCFEHRDLHWGNILLTTVDKNKTVGFRLNGKNYDIPSKGVEVSIIDFTLSRIEYDGVVIFNDLGLDADLFTAEGDYQFEIYKLMQKKNGNNWQRFEPFTNVLWLHYTLDKAITALRYKYVQTKIHKEYVGKLKQLKKDILNYASVKDFVLSHF